MRCHESATRCALPACLPCHGGGVCRPKLVCWVRHLLRPSGAVGDGLQRAGGWQLASGTWAGRGQSGWLAGWMTECRCRRDCTWGGILITLMRPVQAGGRAGGLASSAQQDAHAMAGHCEEQTSTARTKPANSAGQGRRWWLLIRSD